MKKIILVFSLVLLTSQSFADAFSSVQTVDFGAYKATYTQTGNAITATDNSPSTVTEMHHKMIINNAVNDALNVLANMPPSDLFKEGKALAAQTLGKTYPPGEQGDIEAALDIIELSNSQIE